MGKYQWKLFALCGGGWMADNLWLQVCYVDQDLIAVTDARIVGCRTDLAATFCRVWCQRDRSQIHHSRSFPWSLHWRLVLGYSIGCSWSPTGFQFHTLHCWRFRSCIRQWPQLDRHLRTICMHWTRCWRQFAGGRRAISRVLASNVWKSFDATLRLLASWKLDCLSS